MKYDKEKLMEKLVAHEGLRLQVYKDTLGIDTIGIGRNLQDRGISKEELDELDIPSIDHVYEYGITEADAMFLAQNDVQIVRRGTSPCASLRREAGRCTSAYPHRHGI